MGHLLGAEPTPEADITGIDADAAALTAELLAPGISAAPVKGTLEAGGALTAGASSTLPDDARARSFDTYARANVQQKNTAAQTAVDRDRKFALPVAPNRLPEAPLPKDAPMSAPLPC